MIGYFDSSVLLSILLNDSNSAAALELWGGFNRRVSSVLIEVESIMALRRSGDRLRERSRHLDRALAEMDVVNVTREIGGILREDRELFGLRSLDAIHLATAAYVQSAAGEPIALCTFDRQLARAARKLGFQVRPPELEGAVPKRA